MVLASLNDTSTVSDQRMAWGFSPPFKDRVVSKHLMICFIRMKRQDFGFARR